MVNDKFSRAICYFTLEHRARVKLHAAIATGIEKYGVAGNVLSGGAFPHWPHSAKQEVRRLNRLVNRLCDSGFNARPPYARMERMRDIRLNVITSQSRAT